MSEYNGSLIQAKSDELVFSAAQALPNATNVDSTNSVDIGDKIGGVLIHEPVMVVVKVPVRTYVSALTINIQQSETDATYVTSHTIVVPAGAIAAGEDRFAIGIADFKGWMQLNYATGENLAAETVDAFILPRV